LVNKTPVFCCFNVTPVLEYFNIIPELPAPGIDSANVTEFVK
jgi:hypothetical protein